jgi:hypothetical protein
MRWLLGRGSDDVVRVVTVKTATSVLPNQTEDGGCASIFREEKDVSKESAATEEPN